MELRFNDPALRFKGLTVRFLRTGKVLVVPEGTGFHYTLHPGHHSGVIDCHKTNEHVPEGSPARYETLATISQEEIIRSLSAVGKEPVMDLLSLLRPIRMGWIARRRLGVVAFPTEAELNCVSGIRVKAGPAEVMEPLKGLMRVPEFIEDILVMPNVAFLLLDCRRPGSPPYGVLFKIRSSHSVSSLAWIRLRDLRRWAVRMELLFAELFGRLFDANGPRIRTLL